MFCPNCGRNVNDTAKFCVGCGTPLGGAEGQNQTVLLSQEANIKPTSELSGDNRVTYTTENMFYNETSNANLKKSKKKSKKWPVFVVFGVLVIACGVFIAVLRGKGNTTAENTTKKTIKETLEQLEKADVGEYVTFGTYEQDNNRENGAEPIEWLVLEKKDGKVLLLSKYALDAKPYNRIREHVTWETCTLRSWLNDKFYNTAFNKTEQSAIVQTLIKNRDNPLYGSKGGNDTEDKVFLLDFEEFTTYFEADDPASRAKVTEYAIARGGYVYEEAIYGEHGTTEYDGNGWCWLRMPTGGELDIMGVNSDGVIYGGGNEVYRDHCVVRPALWLAY